MLPWSREISVVLNRKKKKKNADFSEEDWSK